MRKIVVDLAVTLDGFIEGPNGETDWCVMDDDMKFDQFLSGIDVIFYGRKSYDLWGNFHPPADAGDADKKLWRAVHLKKKFVFSRQRNTDPHAEVIGPEKLPDKVHEIKSQDGKDIWLYGGSDLIQTFINLELIDQYRLSVHPIILGSGKPLFRDLQRPIPLELVSHNKFRSGVVQLIYQKHH